MLNVLWCAGVWKHNLTNINKTPVYFKHKGWSQ
jgi:hypothetical protein